MNEDHDIPTTPLIRIVCAAIRCGLTGMTIAGVRHRFIKEGFMSFKHSEEGFLTNQNEFLDREQAWKVALAADQIRNPLEGNVGVLCSEHLY